MTSKEETAEEGKQKQEEKKEEEHKVRDASQRNFSDIDFRAYLLSTFGLCVIRCFGLHPLYLIVSRKQICSVSGSKSLLTLVREMKRNEGGFFNAFTQGLFVTTIGMSVTETLFNGIYEFGRYSFEQGVGTSQATAAASAAWAADWTSRVLYTPFNVVAVRQMTFNCPAVQHHTVKLQHTGTLHVIQESYRAAGIKTFFSGLSIALVLGSCTSSLFFLCYVQAKLFLYATFSPQLSLLSQKCSNNNNNSKKQDDNSSKATTTTTTTLQLMSSYLFNPKDNFVLNSVASVCASGASSVVINPYFVLLGRVQSGVASGPRQAVRDVFQKHGWRGFWRGAVAGSAATICDQLLTSTTYEIAMKYGAATSSSSSS